MPSEPSGELERAANLFSAADVTSILRERGWLSGDPGTEMDAWIAEAAGLLSPQASNCADLERLLGLVFHYEAGAILASQESRAVLLGEGAREVIRELAHRVLEGPEMDSDRFKEIVNALKAKLRARGRELFHPIRLALAGSAGGGELDRVILLLDSAAKLPFAVPVKTARQRMREFCSALD